VARLHHNLNRRLYNHHWSADLQLGDAGYNSPDRAIFDTSYIETHGYVLLVNRQIDCLPVRISTYLLFSHRSEHLSPVFDRKGMSILRRCYHDCFYHWLLMSITPSRSSCSIRFPDSTRTSIRTRVYGVMQSLILTPPWCSNAKVRRRLDELAPVRIITSS
jgi:hypothetical protein